MILAMTILCFLVSFVGLFAFFGYLADANPKSLAYLFLLGLGIWGTIHFGNEEIDIATAEKNGSIKVEYGILSKVVDGYFDIDETTFNTNRTLNVKIEGFSIGDLVKVQYYDGYYSKYPISIDKLDVE